jgi:serine/threonine-protein kinase
MAEIYLARAQGPEGFSKDVAIKVVRSFLASDPQFVQMFIAEARLASRLNHANVVQIFDFGKHEDTYYLAMEYVRGVSLWDLRQRCRQQGVPFPPLLAAEIGAQVARGLHYAHTLSERGQRLGVVHRDVTPHNVLLSFDGAVKLTDFGIAKAQTTHTAPGMLKGKFAYMAPEQARGDVVDARTDVFALGIVLWELLTGGRLFDGDSDLAVLRAVEQSLIAPPSRLNPDVPQELSNVVMKALARPPPERFQTAFELEKALTTFVLRTAQTMEDSSIALFLRQLYRAEIEADERPGTPAQGAAAGSRVTDELANGDTVAVDRSKQHAAAELLQPQPTMTMTPVREPPPGATPRPRGIMDDLDDASPIATLKVPDFAEQLAALRAGASGGTEQQVPAHQPHTTRQPAPTEPTVARPKTEPYRPASRRLEPLEVQAPSQVTVPGDEKPTDDRPKTAQYRPPSRRLDLVAAPEPSVVVSGLAESTATLSETETAAPDELPVDRPASSKVAFAAVGAVVVLGLAAAWYFVTRPAEDVSAHSPPVASADLDAGTESDARPPPPQPLPSEATEASADGVVDAGVTAEKPARADLSGGEATGTSAQPKAQGPVPPPPRREARARGTLEVRAMPYAEVTVVGQKTVEVMGLKAFPVEAGTFDVVVKHPKKTMRQRLTVKAGQTVKLDFDANEP